MIGRVSWRVDRLDFPSIYAKPAAVLKRDVEIDRNDETTARRAFCADGRIVRRARHAASDRARLRLQRLHSAAMIAMAMRKEDMRNSLALQRAREDIELFARSRTGIDHGHVPLADHVKVRALKGERTGVMA